MTSLYLASDSPVEFTYKINNQPYGAWLASLRGAAKLDGLGFQIEIKENKTPGGEHRLDPPGAELLAWPKISQAIRAGT